MGYPEKNELRRARSLAGSDRRPSRIFTKIKRRISTLLVICTLQSEPRRGTKEGFLFPLGDNTYQFFLYRKL